MKYLEKKLIRVNKGNMMMNHSAYSVENLCFRSLKTLFTQIEKLCLHDRQKPLTYCQMSLFVCQTYSIMQSVKTPAFDVYCYKNYSIALEYIKNAAIGYTAVL